MRLRHIELFHAIMQTGSLSAAAELLNISQPSASKTLAHAEQVIGLALFSRVHGGLRPTREAELLFAETKRFAESLDSVRRTATNLARHPGGRLRIGCIPSLGLGLVPASVKAFLQHSPGTHLVIQTNHLDELCTQLLTRELDVALAFDPPPRPGILIEELGRARVVYLRPPGTPAPKTPITLADLPGDDWIGIGIADPLGAVIDRRLRETGQTERTPTIEVHTYYVAQALVEHGLGYALVDEFTASAGRTDAVLYPISPPLSVGVFALFADGAAGLQASSLFADSVRMTLDRQT